MFSRQKKHKTKELQKVLENIFGAENTNFKDSNKSEYTNNTLGISKKIKGIVFASNKQQLIDLILFANEVDLKLYPVSTGKNWGYGCMLPTCDDALIVNLSKMQNITIIDEHLGLFSIEPGVTQELMHNFLIDHQLDFMIPTTGAGPSCSLLGNALDRGYGLAPISEHFNALSNFEAVLANGSVYNEIFFDQGCANLSNYFPKGIGPYLSGLFSQSNFAIVTKCTIRLLKRPKDMTLFYLGIKKAESLIQLVTCLQQIHHQVGGVIPSMMLMNKYRFQAIMRAENQNNLNKSKILDKIGGINQMEWIVLGSIHGSMDIIKPAIRILKKITKKNVDVCHIFPRSRLHLLKRLLTIIPFLKAEHGVIKALQQTTATMDFLLGVPSNIGLKLAYLNDTEKLKREQLNPSQDDVRIQWFAPLVPFVPQKVSEFSEIINTISVKHGCEPMITLNYFSSLCLDGTIPIYGHSTGNLPTKYNPQAYFNDLFEACKNNGFFPYRMDIESQKKLQLEHSCAWQAAKKLKKALDPNYIISPGRYGI
jgi:4-cresol dehydrogenase (hydroxylating)